MKLIAINNQKPTVKIVRKQKSEWFYSGVSIASVLVVFLIWQFATSGGLINQIFLPSPNRIWQTFTELIQDGYKGKSLLSHIGISMRRLFIALSFAIAIAVPLGLVAGSSRLVRAIIDPLISRLCAALSFVNCYGYTYQKMRVAFRLANY